MENWYEQYKTYGEFKKDDFTKAGRTMKRSTNTGLVYWTDTGEIAGQIIQDHYDKQTDQWTALTYDLDLLQLVRCEPGAHLSKCVAFNWLFESATKEIKLAAKKAAA